MGKHASPAEIKRRIRLVVDRIIKAGELDAKRACQQEWGIADRTWELYRKRADRQIQDACAFDAKIINARLVAMALREYSRSRQVVVTDKETGEEKIKVVETTSVKDRTALIAQLAKLTGAYAPTVIKTIEETTIPADTEAMLNDPELLAAELAARARHYGTPPTQTASEPQAEAEATPNADHPAV